MADKMNLAARLLRWSRIFWALVVLCLPVTSFKYFPFLGKDTMVRPLAYYPLTVLVVLLVLRIVFLGFRPKFNRSIFLLGLLLLIAFAATSIGYLLSPIPLHGQQYLGRALRAWVTLGGGVVFFLVTMIMNQNEEDLRLTLRWLYVGLGLSIIWGGIQFFSYMTDMPGRAALSKIQTLFSIRKLLVKERVPGFAYEPSWLANQLATIYIPWLWISILTGYRVFKKKWIEPLLMIGAIFLLVITFSRGGLLITLTSCVLSFLLIRRDLFKVIWHWFTNPFRTGQTRHIVIRFMSLVVLLAMLFSVGYLISQNRYVSKIWKSNKSNLVDYLVDVSAGPRLAYVLAGWEIYSDHPWTGVGMGAAGFYLYDVIPAWSQTTLSEITRQLTPESWLFPNIKNLHIRVLAETGILGFAFYVIFGLSTFAQVILLLRKTDAFLRMLGGAGLTIWIAVLLFHFTQDSLIDPNGWFGLGIFLGMAVNCLVIHKDVDRSTKDSMLSLT